MGDHVANALQWSCKLLIRLWLTEQQAVGHHISYHASKSVLSKDAAASGQCNEAEGVISRNVCCCDISRHLGPGFHLGLDHLCVCIGLTSLSPSFPRTWRCPFPLWSTQQHSYLCAMMSFELRYPYDNDISISACGQNYYSTYFSRVCVCFQGHWISFWAH